MRVRLLTVPFAVAIVAACVGSEHFSGPGGGPGIGGPAADAGDAGFGGDAGDAGDGGTTGDGGCNTQILPLGSVAVNDTCVIPGTTTVTTATIIPNGCADVKIFPADGFNCAGSVSGPANAFSGTCSTNPCTSTRLPGTLTCTLANLSTCTIQVCTDSSGTNCP